MRYLLALLFAVSCYGQPWLETPKKKPWPADNFARTGAMGYTSTGNSPWTGSTFGIGPNGVTNAPNLGNELLLNPGLEAPYIVATGAATNWTKNGSPTLSQETTIIYPDGGASSQKIVATADNQGILQKPLVVSQWGLLSGWAYHPTGDVGSFVAGPSGGAYVLQKIITANSTWINWVFTIRAASSCGVFVRQDSSTAAIGYADNCSVKQLNLTNTFSFVTLPSANCIVTIPIKRGTTGFQSGSVICLDSSTYTNFIIGYYDGNTSINVDSCVNGIYTNLITKSITYSDGANLTLRFNADNGWLNAYYNNQPAGQSKLTSIWPSFKNYKTAGLFQTWTNSSITNFSSSPWVDYPADNFTRADGALGNTSTGGKAWTGSTFSIGSNHATNAPTASTNTYIAYLPAYASPSVIVNASVFRGTTGYFHGVLSNYDPATGTNGLVAYLDGAGSCKCDAFVNGNKTNYITGAVTYADGANIELQSSSTSISLYYNGTQVSSTKTTGIWTGFTNFTTVGIYLNSTNGYLTNFYTAPYSL